MGSACRNNHGQYDDDEDSYIYDFNDVNDDKNNEDRKGLDEDYDYGDKKDESFVDRKIFKKILTSRSASTFFGSPLPSSTSLSISCRNIGHDQQQHKKKEHSQEQQQHQEQDLKKTWPIPEASYRRGKLPSGALEDEVSSHYELNRTVA